MTPQTDEELLGEGAYLFGRFFNTEPPALILKRYVDAHRSLGLSVTEKWENTLSLIVRKNIDPQAVEYVLRLRRGKNPLSVKIALLHYLAEANRAYWSYFCTDKKSSAAALGAVFFIAFDTVYRYLKGCYLVKRYALA